MDAGYLEHTFLLIEKRGHSGRRKHKPFESGSFASSLADCRKLICSDPALAWQSLYKPEPVADIPAEPHSPILISITCNIRAACRRLLSVGVHPNRPVHLMRGAVKVAEVGSVGIVAEHGVPQ